MCRHCLYLLSQAMQGCNLRPDATSIITATLVSVAVGFIFALQLHPMAKKIYPAHWRSHIAPIIRLHFNFTCQLCNARIASLHVHHIDGDTSNNLLPNLIPLCAKCHRKAEMGQFKFCQHSRGQMENSAKEVNHKLREIESMLRAEGQKPMRPSTNTT